jgi:hypothetical protein
MAQILAQKPLEAAKDRYSFSASHSTLGPWTSKYRYFAGNMPLVLVGDDEAVVRSSKKAPEEIVSWHSPYWATLPAILFRNT